MTACWPKEVTYIHDVPYLPKSLLKMLSITGGNDYWIVQKIIQIFEHFAQKHFQKKRKKSRPSLNLKFSSC